MSKKSIYSQIESPLSFEEWKDKCKIGEYKILYPSAYPGLKQVDLLAKAPCAILACSGSKNYISYIFQMYRLDKEHGNYVIDEHQYICSHNLQTFESSSAYIHHADYKDRTFRIDQKSVQYLTGSKCLSIIFPTRTPSDSGSLEELRKLGRIDGLDYCYEYGYTQSVKNRIN